MVTQFSSRLITGYVIKKHVKNTEIDKILKYLFIITTYTILFSFKSWQWYV